MGKGIKAVKIDNMLRIFRSCSDFDTSEENEVT